MYVKLVMLSSEKGPECSCELRHLTRRREVGCSAVFFLPLCAAALAIRYCKLPLSAFVCTKASVACATRTIVRMTVAPTAPVLSKRKIQRISLANFEVRKNDITKQLMEAATDLGFFMIENTGITQEEVHALLTPACFVC